MTAVNICNLLSCKGLEKTRKRSRGYSLLFSLFVPISCSSFLHWSYGFGAMRGWMNNCSRIVGKVNLIVWCILPLSKEAIFSYLHFDFNLLRMNDL